MRRRLVINIIRKVVEDWIYRRSYGCNTAIAPRTFIKFSIPRCMKLLGRVLTVFNNHNQNTDCTNSKYYIRRACNKTIDNSRYKQSQRPKSRRTLFRVIHNNFFLYLYLYYNLFITISQTNFRFNLVGNYYA